MDHTIKGLIVVSHRPGLEMVVWRASPDSLAAAGAGALPVSDVSGGLTALACDVLPPRRITEGTQWRAA